MCAVVIVDVLRLSVVANEFLATGWDKSAALEWNMMGYEVCCGVRGYTDAWCGSLMRLS